MHYEIFLLIPALIVAVILFSRIYRRRRFDERVEQLEASNPIDPDQQSSYEDSESASVKW